MKFQRQQVEQEVGPAAAAPKRVELEVQGSAARRGRSPSSRTASRARGPLSSRTAAKAQVLRVPCNGDNAVGQLTLTTG